jgi:hypothetical protein
MSRMIVRRVRVHVVAAAYLLTTCVAIRSQGVDFARVGRAERAEIAPGPHQLHAHAWFAELVRPLVFASRCCREVDK